MRVWFPFLGMVLVAFVFSGYSREQPNRDPEKSRAENEVSEHQLDFENMESNQTLLSRTSHLPDAACYEDGIDPPPVFWADSPPKRSKQHFVVLFPFSPWDRIYDVLAEEELARRDKQRLDFLARLAGSRRGDVTGVIGFGQRVELAHPASKSPQIEVPVLSSCGPEDLAEALKLALASFPEHTGKRIVLISDGNENFGTAEERARMAKPKGVQVDVLPLAPPRKR